MAFKAMRLASVGSPDVLKEEEGRCSSHDAFFTHEQWYEVHHSSHDWLVTYPTRPLRPMVAISLVRGEDANSW